MRIVLTSPSRKLLLLGPSLLLTLAYIGFSTSQFLAASLSDKPDVTHLERAVQLAPGNAEYRYRVGRYFSLVALSPSEAVNHYQSAVALNPYKARYWFALASTYQILGDTENQLKALERAIQSDPKTPDVAWQAANFYLVQGETARAMNEFRVVLENDPSLAIPALQMCWRVNPDADVLLLGVIPPVESVYASFLDFLIGKDQSTAASKVWARMIQLHQPVQVETVFEFVKYLVGRKELARAREVWQQAAPLCDLASYQPSSANLVVNGDFSLPILNGGFDWQYEKTAGVSFALDPAESHLGVHSLLISFGARAAIDDIGLRQLVPVESNTGYGFSAYFKAPHIEGAGGTKFVVQDFYSGATLFQSDDLKNAEIWKQVSGTLISGPDTQLLVIRILRIPAGSPIRGNLWIDGVRLVAGHQERGQ